MTGLHPWPSDPQSARAIQDRLRTRRASAPLPPLTADSLIAGCDLAYDEARPICFAAVTVTRAFGAEVVETVGVAAPVSFPYVPGLLSFREVPALLAAFARLESVPKVVICDGQGLAHPRRFGLACHLGLWLDRPTVGCAKSRLSGEHPPLGIEPGVAPLSVDGVVLGAVVRRVWGVKPVYVSPGHRCDVDSAAALILRCAGEFRIPEPVRQADLLSYALRRGERILDGGGALG